MVFTSHRFCWSPFAQQIIVISVRLGVIHSLFLAFLLLYLNKDCFRWLALFMFGGGTSQTWLWLPEPVKYVGEDVQGVHGEPQAFQWWAAGRHGWKFYRPLFSPFAMTGGIHGKQLFFNLIGDRLHPWCVGCSVHLNCVLKMCWKHCIPHSQTAVSELVAVLLRFSPLSPPRPKPARSCAMCHKELYLPVIACVCVRACTRTHAFSVLTGPHVGSCPCPFSSIEA